MPSTNTLTVLALVRLPKAKVQFCKYPHLVDCSQYSENHRLMFPLPLASTLLTLFLLYRFFKFIYPYHNLLSSKAPSSSGNLYYDMMSRCQLLSAEIYFDLVQETVQVNATVAIYPNNRIFLIVALFDFFQIWSYTRYIFRFCR